MVKKPHFNLKQINALSSRDIYTGTQQRLPYLELKGLFAKLEQGAKSKMKCNLHVLISGFEGQNICVSASHNRVVPS
jgi:LysM repeat protein